MDITNFIPTIAGWLHLEPAQLIFWIGLITFLANTLARRIPSTATGWLGTVRTIATILGGYVANRVAPGVTSEDIGKAALSFPEVAAKVADPETTNAAAAATQGVVK